LKTTLPRNANFNSRDVFAKFNRRINSHIGYYKLLYVNIITFYIFNLTILTLKLNRCPVLTDLTEEVVNLLLKKIL